jgi:phosphoglycolate phosphatase-like HAD superfamily hydrolase
VTAPDGAPSAGLPNGGPPTGGHLAGVELAIFDKDGTLIEFDSMWTGWVRRLADELATADEGRRHDDIVRAVMGVDLESGRVHPHGGLAATPMARLRTMLVERIADETGLPATAAERVVDAAWHAPDPIATARPVADLRVLFTSLRGAGTRIAVATSDDRDPTERTLAHLGVADLVDAVACADDGRPVKPDPAAVLWLCRTIGVPASRTAVIGDSPVDLAMGRSAGVGVVIGVLTGVGDREALVGSADTIVKSVRDLLPPA